MHNKGLRVILIVLLAIPAFKIFNIPGTISSLIHIKNNLPEAFNVQLIASVFSIFVSLVALVALICGVLSIMKPQITKPLLIVAISLLGFVIASNIFGITTNIINISGAIKMKDAYVIMVINIARMIIENICAVSAVAVGMVLLVKEGKEYEKKCTEELC